MARSSAATQADEDAPRYSGRLLLRMPAALHAELAELARREHVSLNQLITNALEEAADRRRRPAGQPSARSLRIALAVNFAAVALAAALAITLLLFALRG